MLENLEIMGAVTAFQDMRQAGDALLNQYAARLRKEIISDCPKSESEIKKSKFYLLINLKRIAGEITFFLRQMPSFFIQNRKLNAIKKSQHELKNVVMAVSSNRLYSAAQMEKPREFLISLIRRLPNEVDSTEIAKEITSAEFIYIFDPLSSSLLWKNKDNCWKNNIFIIDSNFLVFTFFISMLSTIPRFIRHCMVYRVFRTFSFQDVKLALAAFFFIESYKEVLGKRHRRKAFLLTSNSFSTEMLRVYLMSERNCLSICEILHGVPSTEFEEYLSKLIKVDSSSDVAQKHRFIFQVPNLPCYGIFKQLEDSSSQYAINTYINKYLVEQRSLGWELEEYIKAQHQLIFPMLPAHANDYIITIMGASSHEPNYFTSNAFKIECLAVKCIKETFAKLGKPYLILYTPHPCYKVADFYNHPFFSNEQITIYPSTIFTWFISDMGVALYSSALFEANYFGIHSFTPIKVEDNLYPIELLNLLTYPKEGQGFRNAIAEFINEHSSGEPQGLSQKIKQRIERLQGTMQ